MTEATVHHGARVIPMPVRADAVVIACRQPGCRFTASARTEGRAIAAIGSHIASSHWPAHVMRPEPKGVA